MEILNYLSTGCLLIFMVLATYDGLYLHIWKYELFNRNESFFEHKTHTIRAILFPLIIWLLFINNDSTSFWIGLSLFVFDLIILAIDAFSEEDSRKSIGGLSKREYILHLFTNSFHITAILLIIATKIEITESGFFFNQIHNESFSQELIMFVSTNIIPGAIILASLHILLIYPKGKLIWSKIKSKVSKKKDNYPN